MQFICLKEKKFHRSLAFCLVFFISFSVCFGFRSKKVKANPLVGVFESEFAPIIVNILSSFGVVVSLPTARDFLEQEKDYQYNLQMEFQKKMEQKIEARKALAQMGIQSVEKGYLVSKEFAKSILDKWQDYASTNDLTSKTCNYYYSFTFPSYSSVESKYRYSSDYFDKIFKGLTFSVPAGCQNIRMQLAYADNLSDYFYLDSRFDPQYFRDKCSWFDSPIGFQVSNGNLYFKANGSTYLAFSNFHGLYGSFRVVFGTYDSKPVINKQVIDNTLSPVNSQNQGMLITPKEVESVGKVLDPSIPDVSGCSVVSDVPISSVGATSPSIVSASDVGALPWSDVGSIDKPIDIPKDESKDIPKDESKDIPKDEPIDKPKENEGVDFSPFLTLGSGLKDVFPFCLPFDLIKNLHLLSAPPQAPHFDIDFKKAGLAGGDVISIDFSQFELLAKIIRFFLTLGFIYFLIIKTRDMIRG